MAHALDRLQADLIKQLARVQSASGVELRAQLGVSQATFSRLVSTMPTQLVIVGRGRSTRYAARRQAEDLPEQLPIYEIGPEGKARRDGALHAVLPEGYYVEAQSASITSAFHRDLPYFLNELRPAGFLGRLVPGLHPELGLPGDARLWSSNDVLRYVSRFGWNLPGSFVVGDEALTRYLAEASSAVYIEPRDRKRRYPELARAVLAAGTPGSSAGGEQPKFLARRAPGSEVLVKFSTPGKDARSQREVDLLVAEHLAHRVLTEHGQATAKSQLVQGDEQMFLEVERFDRVPGGGRRGMISLLALDAEFLGSMKNWSDSVTRLAAAGHVPKAAVAPTQFRELFGHLIGNTDMHPGNLSFLSEGSRIVELSPSYDMLPMLFFGVAATAEPELVLRVPQPRDASVWQAASDAAIELWQAVADESLVSASFRGVARACLARVHAWRKIARLLPS